jgi:ABC-type phosphate transport system substrate-binding protein
MLNRYQANIAMGRYPMVRPLYYILEENYDGLGSGFSNFLIYEKGQLIFAVHTCFWKNAFRCQG